MKIVNRKQSYNSKAKKAFVLYFCVVIAALLWNLFSCTEYSWIEADAYLTGETKDTAGNRKGEHEQTNVLMELKDDTPAEVSVPASFSDSAESIRKKNRLRGVGLLGYVNTHSLLFSDETLSASVLDARTGEVVGKGTMLLKNKIQYPNDETMIYVSLSEPVSNHVPGDLKVRFSTTGLTRNGIIFRGDKDSANEDGNVPAARLFYEKKVWNPVMSVLYFLVEAAAGLGCLLLYGEKKLPILRRTKKTASVQILHEDVKVSENEPGNRRFRLPKISEMLIPALLSVLLVIGMMYTYSSVIRPVRSSSWANQLTGGTLSDEVVAIEPGTSVRQIFTAGENGLSAIGIRLADAKGSAVSSGKKTSFADTKLEWKLLEETGTAELSGGSETVKKLREATPVLEKDIESAAAFKAAEESVLLPMEMPQLASRGKKYILEISVPSTGEDQKTVYLRSVSDTNGQIEAAGAEVQFLPAELCLLGIYRCNGFIKRMFIRLCLVLLVMITGLYFVARHLSNPSSKRNMQNAGQTAAMYLVSALCMGMVFSFMTPVYTISDERTHIDSVYVLSNHLMGIGDIPGPQRLLKRSCDIDSSIANTMPLTAERYRRVEEELFRAAPESEYISAYTRNALNNVPVLCYLPAAIGFTAARISGRNLLTMIMMARWLNLIACVLIIYLAVRRMPYGAPAMAVIALFPKTLQQMASCSYDGMVIAGTFLFIALCLAAAFDENICIADLLALVLSGLFVAACKGGTYLPVLGLVFLIPFVRARNGSAVRGKDNTFWRYVSLFTVFSAVLLFAGKYVARLAGMFGRVSGSFKIAAGKKTLYTLSDLIHDPADLVCIYFNTFYVRADGLLGELVGKNLSQKWYIVYAFIALGVLGMMHSNSSAKKSTRERRDSETDTVSDQNHFGLPGRLWILCIATASTLLIFLSMLIAFTSIDMDYIDGLQGRYFLPFAPLPLLALENRLVRREGIGDVAILYAADFLLALTFLEILMFYLG